MTQARPPEYRRRLEEYIRENARPADKFSHQPRLYALATQLAEGRVFDEEVVYAAAWLHDLGVFVGHRPEDLSRLSQWDHVAYAIEKTPKLLQEFGFPAGKIPAVLEAIRAHQPSARPASFEATLLRDADILEQLGAVAILRTVSKTGRDTRFVRFSDALKVLRRNAEELPGHLHLDSARRQAEPRVAALRAFLAAAEAESGGIAW